ncbi:MAG: hypothetical protein C4346_00290 [Chloroflexota bacterium]
MRRASPSPEHPVANRNQRSRTRRPRRAATPLSLGTLVLAALILLVIYASGKLENEPGGPGTYLPASPGTGTVGVFVEPDDGRAPILDEIQAATRSIRLQVYLLSDQEIINALKQADRRGVDVRVMLEDAPYGGAGNQPEVFVDLQRSGIEVRWANPAYRFMHIKTFIFDERVAMIMNLNLTRSAFTRNREFGVITTRPGDVQQALAIFEADWARAPDPPDGPLVVSPSSSRTEIQNLLRSATTSLDIYAEVIADRQIVSLLEQAERRGVRVRILVPGDDEEDARAAAFELINEGVDVRKVPGLYIHAKVIIVDGQRAFIGSQNFTATSLDQNRELGIILDDPANLQRITAVFDFRESTPFA